jgi:hypothetical protein
MSYSGVPSGLGGFNVFKRNTDGIASGTVADPNNVDVSSGSVTSHAAWLDITTAIGAPAVTRTKQAAFYGQKFRGKFDLGTEDIADMALTLGVFSAILNAIMGDVNVNTSLWSGHRMGGEDLNLQLLNDIGLLTEQGFQRYNSGNFASEKLHFYYAGQMSPNGQGADQSGGTNPTGTQYAPSFSPSTFSRIYDGRLISTIHSSDSNTERVRYPIQNGYSLGITTVWWDADDDEFTLNYKPLFSDATATGRNMHIIWDTVAKTATPTAVTSVNTSSGVVALTGAPGLGKMSIFTFPTRRVAVS